MRIYNNAASGATCVEEPLYPLQQEPFSGYVNYLVLSLPLQLAKAKDCSINEHYESLQAYLGQPHSYKICQGFLNKA